MASDEAYEREKQRKLEEEEEERQMKEKLKERLKRQRQKQQQQHHHHQQQQEQQHQASIITEIEQPNAINHKDDASTASTTQLTQEENFQILLQAERICFRESPFYDPTTNEDDTIRNFDDEEYGLDPFDSLEMLPADGAEDNPNDRFREDRWLAGGGEDGQGRRSRLNSMSSMRMSARNLYQSPPSPIAPPPPLSSLLARLERGEESEPILPPPEYQPSPEPEELTSEKLDSGPRPPPQQRCRSITEDSAEVKRQGSLSWISQFFVDNAVTSSMNDVTEGQHDYHAEEDSKHADNESHVGREQHDVGEDASTATRRTGSRWRDSIAKVTACTIGHHLQLLGGSKTSHTDESSRTIKMAGAASNMSLDAEHCRTENGGSKKTTKAVTNPTSSTQPLQEGEAPQPLSASERRRRKKENVPISSAINSKDDELLDRKTAVAIATAAAVKAEANANASAKKSSVHSSSSYDKDSNENNESGSLNDATFHDDNNNNQHEQTSQDNRNTTGKAELQKSVRRTKDGKHNSSSNSQLSGSGASTPARRRVRFANLPTLSVPATLKSLSPHRKHSTCDGKKDNSSNVSTGSHEAEQIEHVTVPTIQRELSGRTQTSQDVTHGSDESARLARLRHDREFDVGAPWDVDVVSRVTGFVRQRVLMLQETNDENGNEATNNIDNSESQQEEEVDNANIEENENDKSERKRSRRRRRVNQEALSRKVHRRPLSREQEEMLRCIGLDAFMTLRFLEFGFDVSFWPFLFSLIILIPTFTTGQGGQVGFFRTTTLNIPYGSGRYWAVALFGLCHFVYILRRMWIEWEIFIPLRYDFLENGDFDKSKYQDQFRHTCLVEYVPRTHKNDKDVYKFFDAIFPGQIKRAEILLNTEHLRSLIKKRQKHLTEYENTYAQKVHNMAEYMRQKELIRRTGTTLKKCCKRSAMPKRPMEPLIVVVNDAKQEHTGNVFDSIPVAKNVKDRKTFEALPWHHYMIRKLNKEIDDEYIRLAQDRKRVIPEQPANWFGQWLGIGYMQGNQVDHVHSSTAFVEFRSVVTKQEAIQCNLTGTNRYFELKQIPEIRDIRWGNAHVAQSLIDARELWANIALVGGLIAWSFTVVAIRSIENASELIVVEISVVTTILDSYLPAIIVEGLVRIIPFLIKAVCVWIRFKSTSEVDHYIVRWYFGFRLLTFIFVIVGDSVVESGDNFLDDPMGFLRELSKNVAVNSEFFISYIIVAGGLQIIVRISQLHNVLLHWFLSKKRGREEALSQRRLDKLRNSVKTFHLEEFIPLFLFIFVITALYGSLAPMACLFAAIFFKCAYKVFKYMTLYIYGNNYEGGGFLFYTLNKVLFVVLYFLVLVIGSYLSLQGNGAMAGAFTTVLIVSIALVQYDIHRTFVVPSSTLSLARACVSDSVSSGLTIRERKLKNFLAAKEELERFATNDEESGDDDALMQMLLPPQAGMADDTVLSSSVGEDASSSLPNGIADVAGADKTAEEGVAGTGSPNNSIKDGADAVSGDSTSNEETRKLNAIREMERRYHQTDVDMETSTVSDVTNSDVATGADRSDFFIYRQPSLNRATWEVAPRPYRYNMVRSELQQQLGEDEEVEGMSAEAQSADAAQMWR